MVAGRVVVLNGTASAGTTSLAGAFRRLAPTMWVEIGQDSFARNLLDRWVSVVTDGSGDPSDGFTFIRGDDGLMHIEVGPVGARLLRGYRNAVGAMARAGNDVVVDEAKFDREGWAQWGAALAGLAVTWVRVECDLAVCEERERSRMDRQLLHGLASGIYGSVHADAVYDLAVDTTHSAAEECAEAILNYLDRP
jgi:chloramphenicol 3-O phosphotransferase